MDDPFLGRMGMLQREVEGIGLPRQLQPDKELPLSSCFFAEL